MRGRRILDWSLSTFDSIPEVRGIVVVVPEEFVEETQNRLNEEKTTEKLIAVLAGGGRRQESVLAGLKALPHHAEWVAVHDAARPFVTTQLISATFSLAQHIGAAIPTVAIHDTLVQVDEFGQLVRPISRNAIKRSQTPQIFALEILSDAHTRAADDGLVFTDDATLVNYYGHKVGTFAHYGENRKITTPQDLEKITMQKSAQTGVIRTGQGFDAHPFDEDRPLLLAGVHFNGHKGLKGHSDADVISHAICDAVLGAAGLADIGHYFPSTDPAYENVSGLVLLSEVAQLVNEKGFDISNVDATLIGESPRIGTRREQMCEKVAAALSIDSDCVSIKASTTEKMGFTGREEGLMALSVATLIVRGE